MALFGSEFNLGKSLLVLGAIIAGVGLLVLVLDKMGISLGKLPGDIRIEGERGGFYFPVVTCIVISVVASVLLSLFGKK